MAMSVMGTTYTCPTCGMEVVGKISPPHEYLCTGAPGHGHEPVAVVRIQELVSAEPAAVNQPEPDALGIPPARPIADYIAAANAAEAST